MLRVIHSNAPLQDKDTDCLKQYFFVDYELHFGLHSSSMTTHSIADPSLSLILINFTLAIQLSVLFNWQI